MATDYENHINERDKAIKNLEKMKEIESKKKRYTKKLKNGIIISSSSLERLKYMEENLLSTNKIHTYYGKEND